MEVYILIVWMYKYCEVKEVNCSGICFLLSIESNFLFIESSTPTLLSSYFSMNTGCDLFKLSTYSLSQGSAQELNAL